MFCSFHCFSKVVCDNDSNTLRISREHFTPSPQYWQELNKKTELQPSSDISEIRAELSFLYHPNALQAVCSSNGMIPNQEFPCQVSVLSLQMPRSACARAHIMWYHCATDRSELSTVKTGDSSVPAQPRKPTAGWAASKVAQPAG